MAIGWSVVLLLLRVFYSMMMLVGTISIITFIFVLVSGWSKFKEVPFYVLICSLATIDLVHVCLQWLLTYPGIFIPVQEIPFLDGLRASFIGGYGLFFTDQAQFVLVTLISWNRFAVFVAHPLQPIFTRRMMPVTIVLTLPIIIALTWSRSSIWQAEHTGQAALSYSIVMNSIQYGVPAINLLLYSLIYWRLREQRTETIQHSDRGLLIQAFLEALMLEVTKLVDLIPYQLGDQSTLGLIVLNLKTISAVLAHSLNSLFFLFGNSTVRGVMRRMPFFKRFLEKGWSTWPSSVSNVNIIVQTINPRN